MLYDLLNELSRKQFETRVAHLLEKGHMVELTDKRTRTLNQNAYCHFAISLLACETGNSPETIKREVFKKKVNPDIFVEEKEDPVLGSIQVLRSSAKISVEDMSRAIDRFKQFAAGIGIYIPEPGETSLIEQAEYEIARAEKYYRDI